MMKLLILSTTGLKMSGLQRVAVWMSVAAGLLVSFYLALLEWEQATLCREIRPLAVSIEDHLTLGLSWAVIAACQMTTARRPLFRWAVYASLVVSLPVVLMEIDMLGIDWVLGMGLWMPHWLFCDQGNWFDFELPLALFTAWIVLPFAGLFTVATIVGLCLSWATRLKETRL